ncbi:DMT family protein [uncultured Caulobacter sp.]|uniref:DMT family protein n=1 Tax=uncultured Caulobacter sp. TaxID=158749 RepID=UPI00262C038E|nr:DMT family protein [uncultured Caulobacter sp.]
MSPLVMKIAPWLMLVMSNMFMTFAWYGHLKGKPMALPVAIISSWLIALPEYLLAVPANRIGHNVYSTAQLKTGQEAITLIVFTLFSYFYLGEAVKWTTLLGFGLIFCGAALVFFFK